MENLCFNISYDKNTPSNIPTSCQAIQANAIDDIPSGISFLLKVSLLPTILFVCQPIDKPKLQLTCVLDQGEA